MITYVYVSPHNLANRTFGLYLLGLAVCAIPAHGQSRLGAAPTAEWFADHPHERNQIVAICNNEPGPARTNDTCAAAWQGNIIAAKREAEARFGDRTPPSSPSYWRARPEERREHLARCANVPADVASRIWCPQAEAADKASAKPDMPSAQPQQTRSARKT